MGKICVECGEDCSSRPRIKDPKGRYYCKPCYEAAKRRLEAKRDQPPAPPSDVDPAGMGLLDDLESAPDAPAAAPAVPAAAPAAFCPGCHQALVPGAVICTACGYDVRAGRAMKTRTSRQRDGSAAAWPIVVGIVSLVFGGCGILLHGVSGLTALIEGGPAPQLLGSIAGTVLAFLLSLWLTLAGVGIIRRQQSAVASIRRWAVAKLVLTFLCVGAFLVLLLAVGSALETVREPGLEGLDPGMLVPFVLLLMAWQAFWPIFCLVWFARDGVQRQVSGWS